METPKNASSVLKATGNVGNNRRGRGPGLDDSKTPTEVNHGVELVARAGVQLGGERLRLTFTGDESGVAVDENTDPSQDKDHDTRSPASIGGGVNGGGAQECGQVETGGLAGLIRQWNKVPLGTNQGVAGVGGAVVRRRKSVVYPRVADSKYAHPVDASTQMVARWARADNRKWGDGSFQCWLPRDEVEERNARRAIPDYNGGCWEFSTYIASINGNWAEHPPEKHAAEVAELQAELENAQWEESLRWEDPADVVDGGWEAETDGDEEDAEMGDEECGGECGGGGAEAGEEGCAPPPCATPAAPSS